MPSTHVWNLKYHLGSTERVVGDSDNPQSRKSALDGAHAIVALNPHWRVWVEHCETLARVYQSPAEDRRQHELNQTTPRIALSQRDDKSAPDLRRVIGALRAGIVDSEAATALVATIPAQRLAEALIDCVSRAPEARALFCDVDGYVDGERPDEIVELASRFHAAADDVSEVRAPGQRPAAS